MPGPTRDVDESIPGRNRSSDFVEIKVGHLHDLLHAKNGLSQAVEPNAGSNEQSKGYRRLDKISDRAGRYAVPPPVRRREYDRPFFFLYQNENLEVTHCREDVAVFLSRPRVLIRDNRGWSEGISRSGSAPAGREAGQSRPVAEIGQGLERGRLVEM